tara:strand:- start:3396 stop:3680 length:285 start_codon:yes stop_codon:yes gene_type:complete
MNTQETFVIKAQDLIKAYPKRYRLVNGNCAYRNAHMRNGKVHFAYWSEETNQHGVKQLDTEELVEVYLEPEYKDSTPASLKQALGDLNKAIRND